MTDATAPLPLTGERTVPDVADEAYWFHRHVVAYEHVAGLARGAAVLDAGCGEGYGLRLLADAGARRVVGVDYDATAAAHADARYGDEVVEVHRAELLSIPLPDDAVDLTVSLQVIEHLHDVPGYLASLRRVTRPGGTVVVATPNRLTFTPGSDAPVNPFHVREFTAEELADELTAAGLADVRILGVHHGERIARWEAHEGRPFTSFQTERPPPDWTPDERAAVHATTSADFTVDTADLDTSLDLLATCTVPVMTAEHSEPRDVALVLHTHVPWLAHHGVWPVGEEWLFQAWGQSWLPVTRMLERLAADGLRDVLTLGVTPMVAAQLRHPRLARDLGTWLGGQAWRAEEQRWQRHQPDDVRALHHHHWVHHARLLDYHLDVEARGGLLAVWRSLEERGVVELLGGPATHPYLPLVADPAVVDGQLRTGLDDHARWAGRRPDGLWAPEMGYRPRGRVADPTAEPLDVDHDGTPTLPRTGPELPGLEEHYAAHGIDHVLVDAPTLLRAAGAPDRDWTRRPDVVDPVPGAPDEVVHDGVRIGGSDVTAYARDLSVAYRVWSPTDGYPGDAWYRDYFARGDFGNHPSWRVTGKDVPPIEKATYEPDRALERVDAHVEDLTGLLHRVLDPRPGGLVVAAYDTELFGHWWYEGPVWLERLLRRVTDEPGLRTTTLRSRLARRPVTRSLDLGESSWGYAKGHASWVTPATRSTWATLAEVQDEVRSAVAASTPDADDPGTARLRAQAVRELALLRASDWPFMQTRGNSGGYAGERIAAHADAARHCVRLLRAGEQPDEHLARLERRDPEPADAAALLDALHSDDRPPLRALLRAAPIPELDDTA